MIRFGILGAARVVPMALLEPAARRGDVEVVALAAKRQGVAEVFCSKWNIPRAYDNYNSLLNDSRVDVVYNALPPHLHAEFSIKALRAGKHVLCEKPFAMSLVEARQMQEAARSSGCRIVEAFHDRYHPVFNYLIDFLISGRLGRVTAVSATFNHTIPHATGDFRRVPEMGGGALMDLGCYPVHWCRTLMSQEPEVIDAEAVVTTAGYDDEIRATLLFPGEVHGQIESCMTPGWSYHARIVVTGERGRITVENSILPHRGHSIIEEIDGRLRQHTLAGETTFDYQLDAFVKGLADGTELLTEGADTLGNMQTIDAIYAKAGLLRGGN